MGKRNKMKITNNNLQSTNEKTDQATLKSQVTQ